MNITPCRDPEPIANYLSDSFDFNSVLKESFKTELKSSNPTTQDDPPESFMENSCEKVNSKSKRKKASWKTTPRALISKFYCNLVNCVLQYLLLLT